jgi:hypothetical protein
MRAEKRQSQAAIILKGLRNEVLENHELLDSLEKGSPSRRKMSLVAATNKVIQDAEDHKYANFFKRLSFTSFFSSCFSCSFLFPSSSRVKAAQMEENNELEKKVELISKDLDDALEEVALLQEITKEANDEDDSHGLSNLEVFFLLVLVFALFINDIWDYQNFPLSNDYQKDIVTYVLVFLFILEMIIISFEEKHYVGSTFFYLDVVGTLVSLLDLSYVVRFMATKSSLSILRATRASKIGVRSGDIFKFMLSMLKMFRAIRPIFNAVMKNSFHISWFDQKEKEKEEKLQEHRKKLTPEQLIIHDDIEGKQDEIMESFAFRIAGLVMILIIIIPFLSSEVIDNSPMIFIKQVKELAKSNSSNVADFDDFSLKMYQFYSEKPNQLKEIKIELPYLLLNDSSSNMYYQHYQTRNKIVRSDNLFIFQKYYKISNEELINSGKSSLISFSSSLSSSSSSSVSFPKSLSSSISASINSSVFSLSSSAAATSNLFSSFRSEQSSFSFSQHPSVSSSVSSQSSSSSSAALYTRFLIEIRLDGTADAKYIAFSSMMSTLLVIVILYCGTASIMGTMNRLVLSPLRNALIEIAAVVWKDMQEEEYESSDEDSNADDVEMEGEEEEEEEEKEDETEEEKETVKLKGVERKVDELTEEEENEKYMKTKRKSLIPFQRELSSRYEYQPIDNNSNNNETNDEKKSLNLFEQNHQNTHCVPPNSYQEIPQESYKTSFFPLSIKDFPSIMMAPSSDHISDSLQPEVDEEDECEERKKMKKREETSMKDEKDEVEVNKSITVASYDHVQAFVLQDDENNNEPVMHSSPPPPLPSSSSYVHHLLHLPHRTLSNAMDSDLFSLADDDSVVVDERDGRCGCDGDYDIGRLGFDEESEVHNQPYF